MNKYHLYSMAAAGIFAVLLTSCSDDSLPYGETMAENYKISVGQNDQNLKFDMERSATIRVTANNNMSWSAYSDANWIRVDDYGSGSENLTVSVDENDNSQDKRTGTITISSYRFNRNTTIYVEQAGGSITGPTEVSFPAMGKTQNITVTSNVSWQLTTEYSSFLSSVSPKTGSPGSTTITLISKDNTKGQDDVEYLTLTTKGTSSVKPTKLIELKREKVILEVTTNDNTNWIPYEGATIRLNVVSNSEWYITGKESWLSPNVSSGKQNATVTINIDPNDGNYRYCSLYFKSGQVEYFVHLGQEGRPTPNENDNTTPQYSAAKK